jgi:hypothetical protein
MRAIQIVELGGPESLKLVDIDEPSGDGVLVDVHAASASTDAAAATARERRTSDLLAPVMRPCSHRRGSEAVQHPHEGGAVGVRGATLDDMRSRTALAVGAGLALAALAAAPAHAELYSIDDPADASASLTDITGLEANHGTTKLLVKVRFTELMRTSAAGISVFIDSDPDSRGAEYVLSSGLGNGTDYVLTEARGWQAVDKRVSCDYTARPKWGNDVFRAVISRECFDDASSVRVSVKMADMADGSHPVVDWAPKRHRWSLPMASGLGVRFLGPCALGQRS